MNKLLLLFFALLMIPNLTHAQTGYLYSNGANISIGDSTELSIKGNLEYAEKIGVTKPTLKLNGTLKVSGDIINDVDSLFDHTNGTIILEGEGQSVLLGDYPISASQLELNKSGNIYVETPLEVRKSMELNNGVVVLNNQSLTVYDSIYTKTKYSDTVMISTEGNAVLNLMVKENKNSYMAPVGTIDRYAPVYISTENVKIEGDQPKLSIKTVNKVHELIPNTKNYLMRYWDIQNNDFSSDKYGLDFKFSAGDVVGDARLFYGLKMKTKNGSFWPDPYGLIDGTSNTFHIDNKTLGEYTAAQIGGSEFSDVIVFPNPNDGEFFVKVVNSKDKDMRFQFFDINGALMFGGTTNEGVFPYDFTNYTGGTYFYKIYFLDRVITRKIIINR